MTQRDVFFKDTATILHVALTPNFNPDDPKDVAKLERVVERTVECRRELWGQRTRRNRVWLWLKFRPWSIRQWFRAHRRT